MCDIRARHRPIRWVALHARQAGPSPAWAPTLSLALFPLPCPNGPPCCAVIPPPAPNVSAWARPTNTVAGIPVTLEGTSTCYTAQCSYAWTVVCPSTKSTSTQTVTVPGLNATLTTGPNGTGSTFHVNTSYLAAPLDCDATLTGTGASPPPSS